LIPYIGNGPLISWMYPVFGIRGASWFLGVSEWLFGALLFLGFWNKKLGILGALGSVVTFVMTVTIIPFMPEGWAASAGGFPAMAGNVPFLMKDVVLLAVAIYLLKQDVMRVILSPKRRAMALVRFVRPLIQTRVISDEERRRWGGAVPSARERSCRLRGCARSGQQVGAVPEVRKQTGEPMGEAKSSHANRPFIRSVAFEPDAIAAMSEAFEAACNDLSGKVAPEVVAGRIIAAARSGERDPVRLRAAALAHNESD